MKESRQGQCGVCRGFTVLELITVITIMAIIMAIGVTSFVGLRRGAEVRSAVGSLRTTFSLARQNAVTTRQKTYVTIFPGASTLGPGYVVSNATTIIGSGTNYLSPGVQVTATSIFPLTVQFSARGSLCYWWNGIQNPGNNPNPQFTISEVSGGGSNMITVYGLTGLMQVN